MMGGPLNVSKNRLEARRGAASRPIGPGLRCARARGNDCISAVRGGNGWMQGEGGINVTAEPGSRMLRVSDVRINASNEECYWEEA
jgi:hypothetical protein